MKYNVQLKVYEGPLDLLYDMISKQKIDIKDISIIDITKQYINYITALEKMDLEIASEFITMASKLLEIKSRYLLYKQKDNNEVEDPRLELMEKLEEYKKFKLASQDLKDNITYVDDLYYRKKEEIIIDDSMNIDDISIDAIKNILPYILKVKSEDNKPHKDEKLDKIVRGRIVPVEEKIAYIREIISRDNEVSFIKVIENVDKDEVIATFLSVLELIKSREIVVYQDLFFDMFAYAEPISIKELNDIINEELASKEIEYMLNNLINEYKENNRGIQIIKLQDKYQMCTNKDYSSFIKKVLEPKKKKSLTQTTLETLTIIAYKQPITKVEIEDIRGVKSDKAIQTLLENNLIKEAGRLEKIGKPIIYKTTDEFLKLLNIEKLEDLPPIENYENDNE